MEIEFKLNVTPEECAELIILTARRGLTPEILVDRFLKGAIKMHNGTDMNKCNERIMDTIEYMGDRNSFLAYMFSRKHEALDDACDLAEEVLHSIWSRNGCKDATVMDEKNLDVERYLTGSLRTYITTNTDSSTACHSTGIRKTVIS